MKFFTAQQEEKQNSVHSVTGKLFVRQKVGGFLRLTENLFLDYYNLVLLHVLIMEKKFTNSEVFSCCQLLLEHRSIIKMEYFPPEGGLLTSLSHLYFGLGIL